ADPLAAHVPFQVAYVPDGHAPSGLLTHLHAQVVVEVRDLKSLLAKPGVVRQREAEIARSDDRHAQLAIEPEYLAEVALEVADVVADPTDAKLSEVGQVLADLGGIQVELLGQGL